MSTPVIDVRNLTKDYGKGRGVFDVSFRMEPGEVFGFLGSNGAGKTVTMRHLMGFIRPQKGTASVLGLDCFNQRAQIQGHLGYLPGEIAIADDMTGIAFLTFMAKMNGIRNLDYMHQLIERFQLDPKPKIRKMSKGTKQKVGLVCAFMGKPQVLLLDEPTSGLDPLMQRAFFQILRERNQAGVTVFLSSHVLSEIQRNCTRAAIIRQGRLIACDSVEGLAQAGARRVTVHGQADVSGLSGVRDLQQTGEGVSFLYSGDMNALLSVLAQGRIRDLSLTEPDLEEVFLHYYEERGVDA